MAIDTKEKRVGVLGVARPWMRNVFPVATPDEQWRISVGNGYGGNALSTAIVAIPFCATTTNELLNVAEMTVEQVNQATTTNNVLNTAETTNASC